MVLRQAVLLFFYLLFAVTGRVETVKKSVNHRQYGFRYWPMTSIHLPVNSATLTSRVTVPVKIFSRLMAMFKDTFPDFVITKMVLAKISMKCELINLCVHEISLLDYEYCYCFVQNSRHILRLLLAYVFISINLNNTLHFTNKILNHESNSVAFQQMLSLNSPK